LKDVAGMLRSFDYAAWSAALELSERRPEAAAALTADALAWRDAAVGRFLAAYRQHLGVCAVWPAEGGSGLLELFLLEKAFYELAYEAANRPRWLQIPVAGILDMLATPLLPES
jgi:maltose alpha-D-glucosyltransferase/alpha-amylase